MFSVPQTIPDPPPLDEVQSNHVRSFTSDGPGPQRVIGSRFNPRRPPPSGEVFFNREGPEAGPPEPRPTDQSLHRMEEEKGEDERTETDDIDGGDGGETVTVVHAERPPTTAESVTEGGKPVRGPDDLGVIVIRGVPGEQRGQEGPDGRPRPSLSQLARVTNSSGEFPRQGRVRVHGRSRANVTVLAAPRGLRPRRLRTNLPPPPQQQQQHQHRHLKQQQHSQPPQPAGPGPEPVYYVQYLPPELFDRPAADYIPSRSVLPPPQGAGRALPPGAGRAARSRGHRFGFLRNLFPSWESPETRYIPLTEGRREQFRTG